MEVNETPQVQEQAVEQQPVYEQPKVTIADTSKPWNDEEIFEQQTDNKAQQSVKQEAQYQEEESEQQTNNTQDNDDGFEYSYKGNNKYIAAFERWVKESGREYDIDYNQINEEVFDERALQGTVGKLQAMEYIDKVDPTLHKIIEQGVSLDEYIEQRAQYQQVMSTPDDQLYKGQLFDYLVGKHQEMGTLQTNEQGQLTQQTMEMIVDEVEKYSSNLSPEQVQAKANQIRANLYHQMNNLPEHLARKQQVLAQQHQERFEQERNAYIDHVNQHIDKSKSLVVDFTDQSERNDFKGFFNDMTKPTEIELENGAKEVVIPIFHHLQNDSQVMMEVLRLLHMRNNGYFTDSKMIERKKAFDVLGLAPNVSKGNNKAKSGGTYKGIRIADTSAEDFWKS